MPNVTTNEWLSTNGYRRFPFVEDSAFNGPDQLPNWVVRDARFVIVGDRKRGDDDGSAGCRVTLDSFQLLPEPERGVFSVSLTFGITNFYAIDPDHIESISINRRSIKLGEYTTLHFRLERSSSGARIDARIVVGGPPSLEPGDITVSSEPGTGIQMLPSRVFYVPGGIGIDSFRTIWPTDKDNYGIVHVKDGLSTEFTISDNTLRLTVGSGLGEGDDCPDPPSPDIPLCESISLINGQHADSDGNFNIFAGEGVTVKSGTFYGIPAVIIKTNSVIDEFAKPR